MSDDASRAGQGVASPIGTRWPVRAPVDRLVDETAAALGRWGARS